MLSPDDRDWLAKEDLLHALTQHEGWNVYVEDCLEPVITGLQDMILNYEPKQPQHPLVEMAQIKAARMLLKTLVMLRQKPSELRGTADRIKAEMDTWGRYLEEREVMNG